MRLTITALGLELDLTFGPVAVAADETTALEHGDPLSTGMTFTAAHDLPDECPVPMRCNGWPDEDRRRTGFR